MSTNKSVKPKISTDDKLKMLMERENKRIATKDSSLIKTKENEVLPNLITSILGEMNDLSEKDLYFSHYYDSVNNIFNVKEIAKKASSKFFSSNKKAKIS